MLITPPILQLKCGVLMQDRCMKGTDHATYPSTISKINYYFWSPLHLFTIVSLLSSLPLHNLVVLVLGSRVQNGGFVVSKKIILLYGRTMHTCHVSRKLWVQFPLGEAIFLSEFSFNITLDLALALAGPGFSPCLRPWP